MPAPTDTPDPSPTAAGVHITQPAPGVCTVTWRGTGPLTDEEQDQVAALATSLRPGTHLLVVPPASPEAAPTGLSQPLGWTIAPAARQADDHPAPAAVGSVALPPMAEATTWFAAEDSLAPHLPLGVPAEADAGRAPAMVLAPNGAGTTWFLPPGTDVQRWVGTLADRNQERELADALTQAFRRVIATRPRHTCWELARSDRACLLALDVGMPDSEAALQYQVVAGGTLTSFTGEDGSGRVTDLGREVRGDEQFTIPLPCQALQERRQQLVLLRRTAPADRGRVLRVELDGQEDLGPWHLGEGAREGHWYADRLVIGPDLLTGDTVHLRLHVEEGTRVSSFRYDFLLEPEPEGVWLSEWEAESARREVWFDRTPDGAAPVLDGSLLLRAVVVRPGTTLHFDVPQGYPWFDARVGLLEPGEAFQEVHFRVLRDGVEQFASPGLRRQDPSRPARIHLPAGGRLTLECEGPPDTDLLGVWGNPVLLRR